MGEMNSEGTGVGEESESNVPRVQVVSDSDGPADRLPAEIDDVAELTLRNEKRLPSL